MPPQLLVDAGTYDPARVVMSLDDIRKVNLQRHEMDFVLAPERDPLDEVGIHQSCSVRELHLLYPLHERRIPGIRTGYPAYVEREREFSSGLSEPFERELRFLGSFSSHVSKTVRYAVDVGINADSVYPESQ